MDSVNEGQKIASPKTYRSSSAEIHFVGLLDVTRVPEPEENSKAQQTRDKDGFQDGCRDIPII